MKKYIDAEIEIKLLTAEEALLHEGSFFETDVNDGLGWE